jgi:hypothetical protein
MNWLLNNYNPIPLLFVGTFASVGAKQSVTIDEWREEIEKEEYY